MSIPQQQTSALGAQDQAPYDPTNSRTVVIQQDGRLADIIANDPGLSGTANDTASQEPNNKIDDSSSASREKEDGSSPLNHMFASAMAFWHNLFNKKEEHITDGQPPQSSSSAPAVDLTPKSHSDALYKYHNYDALPAPASTTNGTQTVTAATLPKILNNPGNLRFNTDAWLGMILPLDRKLTAKDYLAFDTIEHGLRAMAINLRNQQDLNHKNTIESIITTYAPKSDNNQTEAYIGHVAEWMSDTLHKDIKRNTELNLHDAATLDAFMKAVVRQENGTKNPYTDSQILAATYDALEPPVGGALQRPALQATNFASVPTDHAEVIKVLKAYSDPSNPVDLEHLDPEFARALAAKCIAMSHADGGKYNGHFYILSTYRDEAKQRAIYEQAKIYENGKWTGKLSHPVAEPGHSAHQGGEIDGKSIAADIQFAGDPKQANGFYRDVVRRGADGFGLETVANDPNHLQLKGANQLVAQRLAHESKPAPVVVAADAHSHPTVAAGRRPARTALRHDGSVLVADAAPAPHAPAPANAKPDQVKPGVGS